MHDGRYQDARDIVRERQSASSVYPTGNHAVRCTLDGAWSSESIEQRPKDAGVSVRLRGRPSLRRGQGWPRRPPGHDDRRFKPPLMFFCHKPCAPAALSW